MRAGIHVVFRKRVNTWYAKIEHTDGYVIMATTQEEAVAMATAMAKRNKVELYVHGKDGKIQWRNSYGNDPHPPKG